MRHIIFSFGIVFLLVMLVPQVQAKVDEHTIAVWLFDEGEGDVITDSSGNGHNGTITGSLKWVDARYNGGLEFPGDDTGYVVVESSPLFEVEQLTIEALANVEEATGKWQGIFAKQEAGCTNRNYGIWVHNTNNVFHAQIGANGDCSYSIDGTSVITDNDWHYLAFTFDGEAGRLYVDGVLESESPYNMPPFFSDDPITIGVPNLNNANGLKGIIDEIRVSNIARTEEEINEAMEVGLQKIVAVEPDEKLVTTWANLRKNH
jgi:hypothetical protein